MLNPTPNVRRLAEAERRRAELQSRQLVTSLAFYTLALFISIIALVMLSLAGFFALSATYGAPVAALIVGAALAVIAALIFYYAAHGAQSASRFELEKANHEIELARLAMEKDFSRLERDLDRMTLGLLGLIRGKTSTPLFTLLLGGLAAWSPTLRQLLLPFLRGR